MDGNVTWIDTELEANVGFLFFSFPSLKKKSSKPEENKKF